MWPIAKIATLLLLATLTQGFYIYLNNSTAQCFYNNIFADEQLLVQVETPIISVAHRIVIKVTANGEIVLQKDIINQVKLTVPRASVVINDKSADGQLEYETCFTVEDYESVDPAQNDNIEEVEETAIVIPKGYLLSVKLMSNFSHKLQNNLEAVEKANVNYRQLEKLAQRLSGLNGEQVSLHQINEVKQKLTQSYLSQLKEKVIIYSIMEIIMIILFTLLQARQLRGYLNDISIV